MTVGDITYLDDPTDARLGDYAALTDPQLRKRYEGRRGVFIAEGPNVVRRLLTSRFPTKSVLLTDQREDEFGPEVPPGVKTYVVPRHLVYDLVQFKLHQGVIAVGERLPPAALAEVLDDARFVAVVEETNDPENLGVLFRNAAGLGVDAILVAPRCSDPLHRRTIRVSMGYVLHLAWAWIEDLPGSLDVLTDRGFLTVALTPADDAVSIDDVEVAPSDRVAVLLGAEGPGLTAPTMAAADIRATIPMRAGVDSLNVGNAAAIAFHVLGRAR
ncbi:MAG TPA: RNA methyltransferase [Nitriliruptorales bacterium]